MINAVRAFPRNFLQMMSKLRFEHRTTNAVRILFYSSKTYLKVDELERNYHDYVPQKYNEKHLFKQTISKELKDINNMDADS